jgi:glycosyltransferase involved in cell wall biosynthesis
MKTIGIDARFYGEAGPGRYAKAIIQHLEKVDHTNKYYIFLRKKGFDSYLPHNPNFVKVLAPYTWYSFQEQTSFLLKLLKYRLDLFYVPHFNIPVLYPGKMVTAIPDIIMHTFSTEKGTTLPKPYFKLKKVVYKLVVLWAVIRSKKVIVPSEATLNDFKNAYPYVLSNKYVLAYEGVDPDLLALTGSTRPEAVLKKYRINKPYLLYAGSFYEHKNIGRLIEAYKILTEDYGFKGQLVLIGKNDKFSEKIFADVQELGLGDKVVMPGRQTYVSDKEVIALRAGAEAYVFPSLKEGFSLTPMEAQVTGLPCVISDIPVHKEVYGDSVLYFDPYKPEELAEKTSELLSTPILKDKLVQKGHELYKKYSWDKAAEITLSVFRSVL